MVLNRWNSWWGNIVFPFEDRQRGRSGETVVRFVDLGQQELILTGELNLKFDTSTLGLAGSHS
jgi:hypothetical protein